MPVFEIQAANRPPQKIEVDDLAINKGQRWAAGLRSIAECPGVLKGSEGDAQLSEVYVWDSVDALIFIPGSMFNWRQKSHIGNQQPKSTVYSNTAPMLVASSQFHKYGDFLRIAFFSVPDEQGFYEEVSSSVDDLAIGEHKLAIATPIPIYR